MRLHERSSTLILLVAFVGLAGCQGPATDAEASVDASASAPSATIPTDDRTAIGNVPGARAGVVRIPAQFRFTEAVSEIRAGSWNALLRTLVQDDSDYLKSKNDAYFGAFDYSSEEEFEKLVELGFPTPAEWLNARRMNDQELTALADTGNAKAMAFLLDRLLDKASPDLHLRGRDDAAFAASPGYRHLLSASELAPKVKAVYQGPFAAYQLGYAYSMMSFPQTYEPAVAGMFVALDRGDTRAVDFLQNYQAAHPDLDIAVVLAIYRSLK